MARSILVESLSQDYVNLDGTGVIANANALLTEAYVRIAAPKNGWMYAPDSTFGSDVYKLTGTRVMRSQSALQQTLQDAIKPMLTSQRIKSYTVALVNRSLGRYVFSVNMIDQMGELIHFNYMVQ